MKKSFRKIVSVLMAVLMLLGLSSAALAANESVTPVVIVSGMASRPLYNEDGTTAFPMENKKIIGDVAKMILPLLGSVLLDRWEIFAEYGVEPVYDLFEQIRCDKNGDSVYNITPETFPEAMANYKDGLKYGDTAEFGMIQQVGNTIGWENTYYYHYDWRMNPLDLADGLNEMIEKAKAEVNSDKVTLIAMSFGGMITSSYMYKYGTDSLKNVVYASTAFNGVELVGRMFSEIPQITLGAALDYLTTSAQGIEFLSALLGVSSKGLSSYGVVGEKAVNNYLKAVLDVLEYPAYSQVFADTFAAFQGIWCLMPSEYYEPAKAYLQKSDVTLSDSFFTNVEDYLFNVQDKVENLWDKAEANGVNIYVVAAYGYAGIPVTSAAANQTDDLIDTYLMSGNAVVAPYGKTLADVEYSTDGFCTEHNHVSTDNIVDAGGCMRPEQTWFIKNMAHVQYKVGTYSAELLTWLATSEEKLSVTASESYPQFVQLRVKTDTYRSLTEGVTLEGEGSATLWDIFADLQSLLISFLNKIFEYLNLGTIL